jgi:hypothetical protein
VVGGDADKRLCSHSSPLAGDLSCGDGIFDFQKLKIGEERRGVFFFMGAPQTQRGLFPSISLLDWTKTSE